MINFNPIEGLDYIFDRFAYLGLSADADQKEIADAIRVKRAGVHPDRLINAAPEILNTANRVRELVDLCAEILMNEELRPLYVERLNEFKEKQPNFVSRDGHPIIDISGKGKERLNLDFLLKEDMVDIAGMQKHVQDMTGYNPKQLDIAKRLHAAEPDEDENRSLLEAALTTKLTYLTVMEDVAWSHAGVSGFKAIHKKHLLHPDDYADVIEIEISERQASITGHVQDRNGAMLLGLAKAPLLLAGRDTVAADSSRGLSTDLQEQLVEKAQKTFIERADFIRQVSDEKKQVLADLLEVLYIEDLGIAVDTTKPYGLHLVRMTDENREDAVVVLSCVVDHSGTLSAYEQDNTQGKTVSQLRQAGSQGAFIVYNDEMKEASLQIARGARFFEEKFLSVKPVRPVPKSGPNAPSRSTGLQT